ncbi:770_t:CDS:2, partial [Funneliformis mosseae]
NILIQNIYPEIPINNTKGYFMPLNRKDSRRTIIQRNNTDFINSQYYEQWKNHSRHVFVILAFSPLIRLEPNCRDHSNYEDSSMQQSILLLIMKDDSIPFIPMKNHYLKSLWKTEFDEAHLWNPCCNPLKYHHTITNLKKM